MTIRKYYTIHPKIVAIITFSYNLFVKYYVESIKIFNNVIAKFKKYFSLVIMRL